MYIYIYIHNIHRYVKDIHTHTILLSCNDLTVTSLDDYIEGGIIFKWPRKFKLFSGS